MVMCAHSVANGSMRGTLMEPVAPSPRRSRRSLPTASHCTRQYGGRSATCTTRSPRRRDSDQVTVRSIISPRTVKPPEAGAQLATETEGERGCFGLWRMLRIAPSGAKAPNTRAGISCSKPLGMPPGASRSSTTRKLQKTKTKTKNHLQAIQPVMPRGAVRGIRKQSAASAFNLPSRQPAQAAFLRELDAPYGRNYLTADNWGADDRARNSVTNDSNAPLTRAVVSST